MSCWRRVLIGGLPVALRAPSIPPINKKPLPFIRQRTSSFLLYPGMLFLETRPFFRQISVNRYTFEIEPKVLRVQESSSSLITDLDLSWVKKYWPSTCRLLTKSTEFNLALQAFDQCVFLRHPPLALLSLWASLETLFSGGRDELRYRISAGMASFLESPGLGRLGLQKEIAKLYDSRSAVAHGRFEKTDQPLIKTYSLTRRVLTKIIEDDHVPTRAELEARLFGAETL